MTTCVHRNQGRRDEALCNRHKRIAQLQQKGHDAYTVWFGDRYTDRDSVSTQPYTLPMGVTAGYWQALMAELYESHQNQMVYVYRTKLEPRTFITLTLEQLRDQHARTTQKIEGEQAVNEAGHKNTIAVRGRIRKSKTNH